MPNYVLVPDPLYTGEPPAPRMIRSWAMRKLFESGMPIADIARRYDVPYARAYKSIHYTQLQLAPSTITAPPRRPRNPKVLKEMTTKELIKIATSQNDPRIAEAVALLDVKDSRWLDKV